MQRLKALLRKEIYQILRDPSTLLISFFLPMLLLFLYGYGVSLDLNHLRIGVVMEDTSPDARVLLESFTNSSYFDVTLSRHRQEMSEKMVRGDIRGFIVIPSYFTDFLHRKEQIVPIQAIADGSETNTANFFQYYVQGTLANLAGPLQGINIEQRMWFNEEVQSRYFLLTGALAIIMTLIGTLLTALVVSREWERGTMEALISTPVTTFELILCKVLPYFVLGILSLSLCVFMAVFFYQLPFHGSFLALLLLSSAFLFSALGVGLLISTTCRTQTLSYQIAVVTSFLPAFILSGFLFEIYSMPDWIQAITYIVPARYFVQCLQTIFLVGNVWPLFLWNIVPMILLGAVCFTITAYKTVKRLD